MIKAIVFDLDNTLLDFMKMKSFSIKAALNGMINAGMDIDIENATSKIYHIYETTTS